MKTVTFDESAWQLVPKEPTGEMLRKIADGFVYRVNEEDLAVAAEAWKAALSSAPAAQADSATATHPMRDGYTGSTFTSAPNGHKLTLYYATREQADAAQAWLASAPVGDAQSVLGMTFGEAKAVIMAMPEQDVRGLAIGQLILLQLHEKYVPKECTPGKTCERREQGLGACGAGDCRRTDGVGGRDA